MLRICFLSSLYFFSVLMLHTRTLTLQRLLIVQFPTEVEWHSQHLSDEQTRRGVMGYGGICNVSPMCDVEKQAGG